MSTKHVPFFSIVMGVYNGEAFIEETIESVLCQSEPDWEFVIVDDASTDRTPEILASYADKDSRIRVLTNEVNRNLSWSLNRGIEAANGIWIAHLDADDRFKPHYLRSIRHRAEYCLEDHSFLSTWVSVIDEKGKEILDVRLPGADEIQKMIIHENFLYHVATSFSKKAWEKVGGYPPDGEVYMQDRAMWMRLFDAGYRLEMVEESLVDYRLHYTNATTFIDAQISPDASAKNEKAVRQHYEWRISLYLKQKKLREARKEIAGLVSRQKKLTPKNAAYYALTFLPAPLVHHYMWKVRPRFRTLGKHTPQPKNVELAGSLT